LNGWSVIITAPKKKIRKKILGSTCNSDTHDSCTSYEGSDIYIEYRKYVHETSTPDDPLGNLFQDINNPVIKIRLGLICQCRPIGPQKTVNESGNYPCAHQDISGR
jgi:hypothetical protein